MKKSTSKIFQDFNKSGVLLNHFGEDVAITNLAPVEDAGEGSLAFVDKEELLEIAIRRKPAAIVTSPDWATRLQEHGITVLTTSNVGLSHAFLRQKYADRNLQETEWGRLHPSAIIHESVSIPDSATIGPNVIIGKNVKIGENCHILMGSAIEHDAVIGAHTVLQPNVCIGYDCHIGENVLIKAGTVIGQEGFGFAQDESGKSHRIPHTGRVVIEDDVVIGSNCCVDRATYKETRIGRGSILDNLCHVAHNVQIGENCILTAMFCVAGSTTIGNKVIASGQSGVIDHKTVGDNVVLVHRAGVTEDLLEPGMYAAMPARPLKEYMKSMALLGKLDEMRKRVQRLEKVLEDGES